MIRRSKSVFVALVLFQWRSKMCHSLIMFSTEMESHQRTRSAKHKRIQGLEDSFQKRNDEHEKFLIHKGRSADMILRSPSLTGVTLCRGWSDEATKAFCSAIHKVVEMNPILSGHAYRVKRSVFARGELWIQAGTFPPTRHEFVEVFTSSDMPLALDTTNATEILQWLNKESGSLLDQSELTSTQIKEKLPLFGATLVLLPNHHALYSLKMSHCIGDGTTYFHLVKQISHCMSGLSVSPMDWNHPAKATHEIYPPSFSWRDAEVAYGVPFLVGALVNLLSIRRRAHMMLLDKHAITTEKRRLRDEHENSHISSNDVITAALCQANPSCDVFVFTENARGVKEGVSRNAAGNFFWEVPVSREVCSRPEELRNVISSSHLGYYKTDKLPLLPFLSGRVGRVTSLASIAENVMYEGVEIISTMPVVSFINLIPLDVAVIFRFNAEYWGVLHNFAKFNMTGLLQDARV